MTLSRARTLTLALLATLVLTVAAGCTATERAKISDAETPSSDGSAAPEGPTNSDLNGSWVAETIYGSPVPTDAPATIVFVDGQASGSTGCNTWNGAYVDQGADQLEFSQPIAMTTMACEGDASTTEANFTKALKDVRLYEIGSNTLTLLDQSGQAIMDLRPEEA